MTRRLAISASFVALAAAGILAALTLAPAALAWSPNDLPPGWSAIHTSTLGGGYCAESYTILTQGHAEVSSPFCTDSATYQADFDAWVDARYTRPVTTTTAPPPTTTVVETTTVTVTTDQIQPPPPPVTTDTLQAAQIADLQSQIAALKLRVDHLEAAADAEWLAYHDALVAGVDPIIASMIARQTGYDLIHGIGAFAP